MKSKRWLLHLFLFGIFIALAGAAEEAAPRRISRIPREPVVSTGLAAVGYSKRLQILEIEFLNGAVYRYAGVPRSIYHELLAANSKTRFYHARIKGRFHSIRIRPTTKENP